VGQYNHLTKTLQKTRKKRGLLNSVLGQHEKDVMSYIDSYDHEYIGSLGYLPIYRSLQKIDGDKWGGYDFSADPSSLILGGGSGEHPTLIVHKLQCVTAKFLYSQITKEEEESISKKDLDYIVDLCYDDGILEFCGWSIDRYASLKEMSESSYFYTTLRDNEKVEDWICKSIGELVYYSLQKLNPHHKKLVKIFKPFDIFATMRNIACSPPGYPPCGGRKFVNGKPKWGLNRWSIKP